MWFTATPNLMFGMGFWELLVVLVIALIFLGPEKIPQTAKTLGRWFYELKGSLDEVKTSFEKDFEKDLEEPSSPSSNTQKEKPPPDSHG